jgi:hypothetical protein
MAAGTLFYILKNGPEFVDWPKLVRRFQLPIPLVL